MVQLARVEQSALAECEAIIERGLDNFIEVGNALLRVRNEKLYREQFDTFQLYCSLKWGMSERHAYRMIEAAEVAGNLSDSKSTKICDPLGQSGPLPSQKLNERVIRPLTALSAPLQRQAWQTAVGSSKNGKPTAKEVKAAVEVVAPKSKPSASEVRAAVINRILESRVGPTPVVLLNGSVKNSATLRELKRLWKRATTSDRDQFRAWIENQ